MYNKLSSKASNDYFPVLDGLRGISILLVFLSHCNKTTQSIFPGTLGVIIFFVISGFLITRQLITEIEASGNVDLRQFYFMRLLRLLPTLLFYLFIFVPILLQLGAVITLTQIASGLFYLANYYHIFVGYPPNNPMPILWSLAVEEHYYIFFPFLLLAFRKRLLNILPLIIALLGVVPIWRIILYQMCLTHSLPICGIDGVIRTQATDTIFDCILYGVLAALLLHYYYKQTKKLFINRQAFLLSIAVLLLSLVIRNLEFRATLRYSLQAFASAVIMTNLLFGESGKIKVWLESKSMVFIGKISYPLYLMHFGVYITFAAIEGVHVLNGLKDMVLYLTGSIFLACVAYYVIEKPMAVIRRKQRTQHERKILLY